MPAILILTITLFSGSNAGIAQAQENEILPIGVIQGAGDDGSMINKNVTFRGVVTGVMADQNSRGIIFHTIFVQDLPGNSDSDPRTSDGIPVFIGTKQPQVAVGDVVLVTGNVIEYFDLTEIEESGVQITVESSGHPLPEPIALEPPSANEATAAYYEPLEGMLVSLPGEARVVGATFSSCSFAVLPAATTQTRILRHQIEDPVGYIVPILNQTDVTCAGFPDLKTGDTVSGIKGPLTYHFGQFKVVQQSGDPLHTTIAAYPETPQIPVAGDGQISVATFNIENYFDNVDDTGDDSEPKPSLGEIALRQQKVAYTLGETLKCPTLVAIQEVENEALLLALAAETANICGFTYQVSHLESADGRGIDLALLSNPDRVEIKSMALKQTCTLFDTDIKDETSGCTGLKSPLFSRPPFVVDLVAGGEEMIVIVNHFKSKRGGEEQTALRRAAQAQHINDLVSQILTEDGNAGIIVTGDFNDYDQSPSSLKLSEQLLDVLQQVPAEQRYSYVFGGASQLIDGIFVSPALADAVNGVTILHINADFPDSLGLNLKGQEIAFRSSDHDIPLMILNVGEGEMPAEMEATEMPAVVVEPTILSEGEVEENAGSDISHMVLVGLSGLLLGALSLFLWQRFRN